MLNLHRAIHVAIILGLVFFWGSSSRAQNTPGPSAPTEVLAAFQSRSAQEGESLLFGKQTFFSTPDTAAWYQERASALCAVALYAKGQGSLLTAQVIARRALLQLKLAEKLANQDATMLAGIEELRGDIALHFLGDSDEAKQHYGQAKRHAPALKSADEKVEGLK